MSGRVSDSDSPRDRFVEAAAGNSGEPSGPALNADELLKVCAVIGRKWTPAVITTLAERPIRRGELFRRLSGIHCKVLQQSLNGLIRDGMVIKSCGLDEINRVQSIYGLTELGESLLSVFEPMQIWCSDHLSEVIEAQQHADGHDERIESNDPALSEGQSP